MLSHGLKYLILDTVYFITCNDIVAVDSAVINIYITLYLLIGIPGVSQVKDALTTS